jgi:hypothetical protein
MWTTVLPASDAALNGAATPDSTRAAQPWLRKSPQLKTASNVSWLQLRRPGPGRLPERALRRVRQKPCFPWHRGSRSGKNRSP